MLSVATIFNNDSPPQTPQKSDCECMCVNDGDKEDSSKAYGFV